MNLALLEEGSIGGVTSFSQPKLSTMDNGRAIEDEDEFRRSEEQTSEGSQDELSSVTDAGTDQIESQSCGTVTRKTDTLIARIFNETEFLEDQYIDSVDQQVSMCEEQRLKRFLTRRSNRKQWWETRHKLQVQLSKRDIAHRPTYRRKLQHIRSDISNDDSEVLLGNPALHNKSITLL